MAIIQQSLFDDSLFINLDDQKKTKNIIDKIKNPKGVDKSDISKYLKSDKISFQEKLGVVTENVHKILGKYEDNIICIYDYNEYVNYIDVAIKNGIIAVDTETIGTRTDISKAATDPYTCKIAGLCLYTPGMKQAYIPINHCNIETGERLPNQLTEDQVNEQLKRLLDIKCIFHNGKFDYKVIYYTCGTKLPIYWDTMIGAQLLNENELAGLKFQFRDKIDPDQEKYSIEELFNVEMFPYYPPELFAFYAATDAYETFELFKYQKDQFEKPGNEKLYNLFLNIEMPNVTNIAEMEMWGMAIDKPFADRLSKKFHTRLDEVNSKIDVEISSMKDKINSWRNTPEANSHQIKSGKQQKSMNEQLSDPIELTSPIQLGILLYDILKVLKVGRDGKKVVDEATLLTVEDKLPLIKLILKKREYEKYLGTYIDALPTLANPIDGRIHAKINQMGREEKNVVTGRMSSSDPNIQNIPARGQIVTVRCLFVPSLFYKEYNKELNYYDVPIEEETLMNDGTYQWSSYLKNGDVLDTGETVDHIEQIDRTIRIYVM